MDKKDLAKLALIGLSSGMMVSCQAQASQPKNNKSSIEQVEMSQTEKDFSIKLNRKAKVMFRQMNHEERSMAMEAAAHGCKGANSCKGEGGCKTDKNSCRGQNSCKGKGGCKLSADQAVEVLNKKMQEKRSNM